MGTSANRNVKRQLVERIARPQLAPILAPFADALHAAGIDPDALAASHQDDRALVHRLVDLLNTHPSPLPLALRQILVDIGDVATSAGQEELVALDVDALLPRGTLGAEDLAALAYLDHPDLFKSARVRCSASAIRTYSEYEAGGAAPIASDAARMARVEATLAPWLKSKNRTSHCKVFAVHGEERVTFELGHGRPPGTRDVIEAAGDALVTRQVTDVTAQRMFVIWSRVTRRLAVHGNPGIKEAVRRAFGEAFFGAQDHFRSDSALDLTPLATPDIALTADVEGGPIEMELRAFTVRAPGGGRVTYDGEGVDVRACGWKEQALAAIATGTLRSARVEVKLAGRDRFARVDLGPGVALHFDRDDVELDRAVRAWLVARRVLSVSEALRATG